MKTSRARGIGGKSRKNVWRHFHDRFVLFGQWRGNAFAKCARLTPFLVSWISARTLILREYMKFEDSAPYFPYLRITPFEKGILDRARITLRRKDIVLHVQEQCKSLSVKSFQLFNRLQASKVGRRGRSPLRNSWRSCSAPYLKFCSLKCKFVVPNGYCIQWCNWLGNLPKCTAWIPFKLLATKIRKH